MRRLGGVLLITLVLLAHTVHAQRLTYISPQPKSTLVSLSTNIILRSADEVDPATLTSAAIDVVGTKSGPHIGTLALSDDKHTITFSPAEPFVPGETVEVTLHPRIQTVAGTLLGPTGFSFVTTPQSVPLIKRYAVDEEGRVIPRENLVTLRITSSADGTTATDTIPSDFPKFQVTTSDAPAPGYFLLTTPDHVDGVGYFAYMVDNNGNVVKYKRTGGHTYDFKQQPNGFFSFAEGESDWGYAGGSRSVHRVVDSSLAPVDSFRAGNGYDADSHEFRMLANGHVLLHAYDIQYFDLSAAIPGGNKNAIVVGSILQELDLSKNVVFQWRSWDYIPIRDTYMSTGAAAFDYIHVNGYDMDDDGNILASFRNTCDIVKINRMTGDILWRLGGKGNQFTFVGETNANAPTYFTYQHSVRKLANGNIILFDNGNLHPQRYSRGVEYAIDEAHKIATLVWEYRHTPDIFAPARGSIQRLSNGNTVIGWGSGPLSGSGIPSVTEVRPDKSVAFEMVLQDGVVSYRGLKYALTGPLTPAASVTFFDVLPGVTYNFKQGDTLLTGVSMAVNQGNAGYNRVAVKRYEAAPLHQSFNGLPPFVQPRRWVISQTAFTPFSVDITFDNTALSGYRLQKQATVYSRDSEGQGVFTPLTSVFDSVKRSLTISVTKFGEFIIGVPEAVGLPAVPALLEPGINAHPNQTLPILLRWSSPGHLTGSHLQVASDSSITSLVINDSTLRATAYLWSGASPSTPYYWRVKVKNEQGSSGWSAIGMFSTAAPYLVVSDPQQGARVPPGSQTVIRWESNVGAFVNIRLYRDGLFSRKIVDSSANTGRYVWRVDSTSTVSDTTYSIRVMIFGDTTRYSDSKRFTIARPTGVEIGTALVQSFSLDQNYPNPFNPTTVISYQVPVVSDVRIAVYDLLGREVAILVNERKAPGHYAVPFHAMGLASGVYFYRMRAGDFVDTRRLLLVR